MAIMNFRVPLSTGKFLTCQEPRRNVLHAVSKFRVTKAVVTIDNGTVIN